MKLPTIWGPGSLFAYSGLDGPCTFSEGLVGTLCADRVGVLFHTAVRSQLSFALNGIKDIEYSLVATDIIQGTFTGCDEASYPFTLLFLSQDVVAGQTVEAASPLLHIEADAAVELIGAVRVYDCGGEFIAFTSNDGQPVVAFAYAVSRVSKQDAADKAMQALQADLPSEAAKKTAFFAGLPQLKNREDIIERMYYKCFSVMKSQVYSPEGRFQTRWTTPDRLPHKRLWLWDSVFHSIGNKYISPELAYESIRAVFNTQQEDGLIPHMASPYDSSAITQPPVIAWGLYELYRYSGNRRMLEECYDGLKRYLQWNKANRDKNGNWLFEWLVEDGSVLSRCDECGMDNSPRFDDVKEMDAIDFSCFMANEARVMVKIAEVLGKQEDMRFWQEMYEKIKQAVNLFLWDEEDRFYYDKLLADGEWKKVKAVSSFLPLFAGICGPEQAGWLVHHLEDPASFGTKVPVPSISRDDATFGTDMWRGPVWINYSYMIVRGLQDYGYSSLAEQIVRKTIHTMAFWYEHDGSLYEFYDSMNRVSPANLNRKGKSLKPHQFHVRMHSIRDYGWSCTLLPAMLLECAGD